MIVRIQISKTWARHALWKTVARAAVAAGLVLFANSTADLPAATALPRRVDRRVERLDRFFRLYNCREHHVLDYLRAADENGLDYRMLPAIAIRETGCGATAVENNHWGYH